ncbi:MAG TPA: arginase family protein [Mycobacteriales bacterium]|nr:arginase family protein [Mycobacteriales bacterium]HWB67242.1 arginase family protein [Mycobacteriales bacterium]
MNRGTSDHRWPSAAEWLAAGPGARPVDLAVIGIPTFATSVPNTGAHATPAAVRRALDQLTTWSPSRGVDLSQLIAPWDRGDVDDPDVRVEGEWRVRTAVETAAAKARLLVVIGGDNSLTYPAMAGVFGDDLGRAGLVTVDAHHDLREARSNGAPVRELIAAGLPGERIVQVGIADWANSRSYATEAHARGVTVIGRGEVAERGIAECMREALDVAAAGDAGAYVDLDLNACDRAVAPACPASLPGGLSAREMLTAAFLAGADPRVRAVDITEVDATQDADDERTVRLAAMCLLEIAAGLATRSDR